VSQRIKDIKVLRLVRAFLKAGVMAKDAFIRSSTGIPQGCILSPCPSRCGSAECPEETKKAIQVVLFCSFGLSAPLGLWHSP